ITLAITDSMRFLLVFLSLASLLLHSSEAKSKKSDWDSIIESASGAFASAADTVGQMGKKAADGVTSLVQSPEAANGWNDLKTHASSALAGAAETVGQLGQTASEHVSSFVQSPTVNDGWNELKTRSAQAASAAYDSAAVAADSFNQKWSEVAAAKPEGETWPEYVWRLAGNFAHGDAEEKKELVNYVFFWKDVEKAETWSEAGERFARRFNYRSNENVKRTANVGFALAICELAGVFRQINQYGEAIYKSVSGWAWGMRKINSVGPPIYKPSLFGSAFSGLGSVFWYGSVIGETVNMVNAINEDRVNNTTTHTVHASSKAVLSWTGAATGASAGATLFSFVPVIGPLAGGIIGGFAGAYSGGVAGEAAADAYDRAFEKQN
ncbi:hypothetical protein PENTCL1PPCAC_813, partial [Pristionchus entomophagus]